jgi:hypothetical protein
MNLARIIEHVEATVPADNPFVRLPRRVRLAILATGEIGKALSPDGEPNDDELRELWKVLKKEVCNP